MFTGLLGVFELQIVLGLRRTTETRGDSGLAVIGDVLIASLLFGSGRVWEQVGSWDRGIVASVSHVLCRTGPHADEQQE